MTSIFDSVVDSFNSAVKADSELQRLFAMLENGETLTAAQRMIASDRVATKISGILSDALKGIDIDAETLADLVDNVISPSLKRVQNLVGNIAQKTIDNMNRANGIGLKSVRGFEPEWVDNLANKMKSYENPTDAEWLVGDDVIKNMMRRTYDNTIRKTVDAMEKSGRRIYLRRRCAGGENCAYCRSLEYEGRAYSAPDGVWSRHRDCDCTLEYWDKDGEYMTIY